MTRNHRRKDRKNAEMALQAAKDENAKVLKELAKLKTIRSCKDLLRRAWTYRLGSRQMDRQPLPREIVGGQEDGQ